MSWLRFSLAVLLTSIGLVGVLFVTGAYAVSAVFANGPQLAWDHANLPPELAGLKDMPADQRFSHFKGVTANVTDKDGKPIAINVTPGVATSVSATSITINGNDGASHTYALDSDTYTHGGSVATGKDVVVVTVNNSSTARAVVSTDGNWGGDWHGGPPWRRQVWR